MRALNVNDFIFDLDRIKAITNSDSKMVSLIEKLQYMINEYEKQHPIEAEPVRHGRWIERRHELRNYEDYDDVEPEYEMFPVIITDYECSECGRVESECEPYCNCGAKMDAKESKNACTD